MRALVLKAAVLGLAMSSFGCKRPEETAAAAPSETSTPIHVQASPVTQRAMPELLTLTGSLRASESTELAADVNGKVTQTFMERGQPVKRGQLLAIIDSRSAAFAATAAQAQAKVAQSELEQARRECERVKHLLDTGAISQAEYDRQTSQCTAQQWSAAAAEAQVQTASKMLGDASIRAPFDGIIGERFINVGQYVQPQTRVASLYAPDPLRLELTVPEANVAAIQPDMPVGFTVAAFGDQAFTGRVKYISPNIREASRDLVVEAVVPNPDMKLKPGMFAIARIRLGEKTHPVVPLSSVVKDDTGARVFVVAEAQAQERLVQLGEASGEVVAVVSGVLPGENVIDKPGPGVRDGARVE
jgi:membrane fusion protein, multidrug efflux system